MTAHNCPYLTAMVLAVMGWGASVYAEDDVIVISTPAATTPPAQKTVASDGTPVVHKSLHKKKYSATATAQPQSIAPTNTASAKSAPVSNPVHPVPAPPANPAAWVQIGRAHV